MSAGEEMFVSYASYFGLPAYEREYRFCPGRKWRADFAFVEQRTLVEIDGGTWKAYGGRHGRDSDREKHNAAVALGWRTLRFSPQMLEDDPARCMAQVAQVLQSGGDDHER